MEIGSRITYFRKIKGYSVNKLANLAGISQSYLRDIELGNKNPTVMLLTLLCDALTISLKEFFDEENTESFIDNDLIQTIYQLSPTQRDSLNAFLKTMISEI